MPLAMSIEILAEAASCLLPELVVTGLRDLRAHRWLAFGETPRTLEMSARGSIPHRPLRARTAASGCASSCATSSDEQLAGEPLVEATVLLSDAYAPAPAPAELPLGEGAPSRIAPEQLYEEAMFHRPLWQGVRSVELVVARGRRERGSRCSRARACCATSPSPASCSTRWRSTPPAR